MASAALTRARGAVGVGARALFDLLLPPVCVVCRRARMATEHDLVCGRCWLRCEELPRPRCERCGHPLRTRSAAAACSWCELLPPYVRAVRSGYMLPGGAATQIVHALKYSGWHAAGPAMGRRLGALRFPDDVERERAALVPVPLAAERMRERGYNQSERIAAGLARAWGIPVRTDLLARTRSTATQTRLTPGERSRNVSGAFHAIADHAALRGLHLVLVDDVVTTGATLNACAAALHGGGARILSFVTFGRAPAAGDRW